jgi:hypothetical protein
MDPHDPTWRAHLDVVTAMGEASATHQLPLPTDEQLWAVSRAIFAPGLPEQVDDDLLGDLRDAFDEGRRPARLDLQVVADAINARGVSARVLNSGGNTATLYTGQETLDAYGDARFSASAGPGYFEAPGHRSPVADAADFGVGPDDDSWGIRVPEHATIEQIADLIVAVTAEADAQSARFTATAAGMWTVMSDAYPDADTPDQPPGLDDTVAAGLRVLLAQWLDQHWWAFHDVPSHLAAMAARTDTDDGPA